MSDTYNRLEGARSTFGQKKPVRAASTGNLDLSGYETVDGVALSSGDDAAGYNLRVLVKDQTDSTENGVYDFQSGDWERTKDFDGNTDWVKGSVVFVTDGTANKGEWYASATDPPDVGESGISFLRASVWGSTSATDNAVARFDGVTGRLIQNSGVLIGDTVVMSPVSTGVLGSTSLPWNGAELSSGVALRWAGAVAITHGSSVLNFTGANSGYSFDAAVTGSSLISAAVNLSAGTTSPDRRFHVEVATGSSASVTYVGRLTVGSSVAPSSGIGVGLEFEVETASSNFEIGATIEAIAVDVTSSAENFDIVVKTMSVGAAAAEKLRVSALGNVVLGTTAVIGTTAANGFAYIPTCTGTPTGTPSAYTGKSAMIHDTGNNRLWLYSIASTDWRYAALTT